jgi:hypothetical protein
MKLMDESYIMFEDERSQHQMSGMQIYKSALANLFFRPINEDTESYQIGPVLLWEASDGWVFSRDGDGSGIPQPTLCVHIRESLTCRGKTFDLGMVQRASRLY